MEKSIDKIKITADLLADIACTLMMSGAHTQRMIQNSKRFAESMGCSVDFLVSLSALTLTVRDKKSDETYTIVRAIPHIGVDFKMLTQISLLSWQVKEEKHTVFDVAEKYKEIKKHATRYKTSLLFFFVGLAGAALSRILGGTLLDFLVTFLATVGGLFVRQLFLKKGYKPFIVFSMASFVAVSIVNTFRLLSPSTCPLSYSLAACVLFLIPGVPLINSLVDLLEGHISVGLFRGIFGMKIVFAIALGFFASLTVFAYYGFV